MLPRYKIENILLKKGYFNVLILEFKEKVMEKLAVDIKEVTNSVLVIWAAEAVRKAPAEVQSILGQAKLDWLISLTEELNEIYNQSKRETMSEGKLIIANTVLGSLVEGWLRFFYSVYLQDYEEQDTKINKQYNLKEKKVNLIAPNELSYERLKQFTLQIWQDETINNFIENAQHKRNIIHSFNEPKHELGNQKDFEKNMITFSRLIKSIENSMPSLDY